MQQMHEVAQDSFLYTSQAGRVKYTQMYVLEELEERQEEVAG